MGLFIRWIPRYMVISVAILTYLSSYFLFPYIGYVWLQSKLPRNLVNEHTPVSLLILGLEFPAVLSRNCSPWSQSGDNGLEDWGRCPLHVGGCGGGRRGRVTLQRDGTWGTWFIRDHFKYFTMLVRRNIYFFKVVIYLETLVNSLTSKLFSSLTILTPLIHFLAL